MQLSAASRQEKERRGQDTASLSSKRRPPVAERPAAKRRPPVEMPPPKVPQKAEKVPLPKEVPVETWNSLEIALLFLVWVFT